MLAGELQKAGMVLLPVTVFIISWVTVVIISLPAKAVTLGWLVEKIIQETLPEQK